MKREQFSLGNVLFCSLLCREALFLKPYNSLCRCRASGEEGRLALHDAFVVGSLLLWLHYHFGEVETGHFVVKVNNFRPHFPELSFIISHIYY